MNATTNILFEAETKMIMGTTTYIVTAHFDDNREPLKKKIKHLLCAEICDFTPFQTGHKQTSNV